MRPHNDLSLRHSHRFASAQRASVRRTWAVLIITVAMMVAEVAAGWWTGSMALLSDGWHMGTHAFALGVSVLAYWFAQKYRDDPRFSLGTWKVEVLGAYTSALMLGVVAVAVLWESGVRLLTPREIGYQDALIVAVIGLVVNAVCAGLLHSHDGHAHDLNARSAYLHVMADALTSLLAIFALALGWWLGWAWADAAVGILGAVLIFRWAVGLFRSSSWILLDREMDAPIAAQVRAALEADGDTKVTDLHLTRVSPDAYAMSAAVVADAPFSPEHYRSRLAKFPALAHVIIECNPCRGVRPERDV